MVIGPPFASHPLLLFVANLCGQSPSLYATVHTPPVLRPKVKGVTLVLIGLDPGQLLAWPVDPEGLLVLGAGNPATVPAILITSTALNSVPPGRGVNGRPTPPDSPNNCLLGLSFVPLSHNSLLSEEPDVELVICI